ncbi:MAG: hypothetical protein KAJ39_08400 [Gammaproteobacteria bacterium]|nr:hypothetical protein [Gammaproteobacteria bacterium]
MILKLYCHCGEPVAASKTWQDSAAICMVIGIIQKDCRAVLAMKGLYDE